MIVEMNQFQLTPTSYEPPSEMAALARRLRVGKRRYGMSGPGNSTAAQDEVPVQVSGGKPKWVIPVAVAGAVAVAGGGYLYLQKGKKKGK